MTQSQLSWIAGVLEGTGSIVRRDSGQVYIRVLLRDRDAAVRLRRLSGGGRVRRWPGSSSWAWELYPRFDVAAFLNLLHPHLGTVRQEQIDKALA